MKVAITRSVCPPLIATITRRAEEVRSLAFSKQQAFLSGIVEGGGGREEVTKKKVICCKSKYQAKRARDESRRRMREPAMRK